MKTFFEELKEFNFKSSGAFDDLKLCPDGMTPLDTYQSSPQNPATRRNVGGEKQFGIGSDIFFFYDIKTESMPVYFLYSKQDLKEYMNAAEKEYKEPSQEYCNKHFLPTMYSERITFLDRMEEYTKMHFFINIKTDSKYLGFNSPTDREKYYNFIRFLLASKTQSRGNDVYTKIIFYKYRSISNQRTYFYFKPIFMKQYSNKELSRFLQETLNQEKNNDLESIICEFVLKYRHQFRNKTENDFEGISEGLTDSDTIKKLLKEAASDIENIIRLEPHKYQRDIDNFIANSEEVPLQQIFYGCPGTGKSHEAKKIAEGEKGELIIWYDKKNEKVENPSKEQRKELSNNVFRTTFHPDYDYATFVGCYKPVKEKVKIKDTNGEEVVVDKLNYKFIPQVFTNAYVAALKHPDDPIYLIIEEINRGNCAQIFGDLFQLLDRTNGVSDYEIKPDTELAKYLKEQGVPSESLSLPANLHIFATMNTSDQSLFPMDSAFKRRWAMEYIPIKYDHPEALDFTITIGDNKYPWIGFLKMVNEKIFKATDSEDKQMGEFFIKNSITEKEFINKVMFYIWNDVCKDLYNSHRVSKDYFLKTKNQSGVDIFTFTNLFGDKNIVSKLLDEFILYLEKEYADNHDVKKEGERIDWNIMLKSTEETEAN